MAEYHLENTPRKLKKERHCFSALYIFNKIMFRDSRPIALRKLMPFSNRSDGRKHRTSDSLDSDEDPLLDEEAAVK